MAGDVSARFVRCVISAAVIAAASVAGLLAQPSDATPTVPEPVAAFAFDENAGTTANDSASGNDGTVRGAQWVADGKFGSALDFDGQNDRVTVPDSAGLQLTDGFTLEAWVKPDDTQMWASVITKETDSGWFGYQLYGEGDNGKPVGGVADDDFQIADVSGSASLPLDQWSHLALTSDGEDLRLYVDGELDATAGATAVQTTDGDLQIGGNLVWGEYFDGQIDEVRI